ncbi:MAG: EAL domain-containing protein [Pseudomonadota bacterium]
MTLFLALLLGAVSGVSQIAVDLGQEKDAVQYSAEEFLSSVAPSAESAVYNFYLPAAEQVASGLFTQRAIKSVTIVNEGEMMVAQSRETEPTLPNLGRMTDADIILLERVLYAPENVGGNQIIGTIAVEVDRSIVAPAFVNRMLYYFIFATVKNFVLGILLIWLVYRALARHIITLAETTARWTPATKSLDIDYAPWPLQGTELDQLSDQIKSFARTATGHIEQAEASREMAEQSNTALTEKSELLSEEVQKQNARLQEANDRLKELAEIDALTGLYNRRSFDLIAQDVFAAHTASGDLAVMMIDVDSFKIYNDYYGHQEGDKCLAHVARLLDNLLNSDDVTVARYGGEEFIALVAGEAATGIDRLAEKVHGALASEAIEHQRSTVADRVTVSIGVAFADDARCTLGEVISSADEALYEAKARGRNRTVMSSKDLRERLRQDRNAALSVFRAVELEAFEPFFQPQVDARTGALVGLEALVRRRLADDRFETPAQFMQVARFHGYLADIDRIVLKKVRGFLAAAQRAKIDIPRLSLNTPHDNLLDRDYVREVTHLSGAFDTQIVLELLETAMLDEPGDLLRWQLDTLREHGIDIEIDDYGTGHTSVISLMNLKPSRIKIAKELVLPMAEDQTFDRIVASIIQMGAALSIDVMAEGVETKAMSNRLLNHGCPIQQGFFFAHPMPAKDFLAQYTPNGQVVG